MPATMKRRTRKGAKLASNLYDGKLVVHFAGFGGACRGIELAEGRAVDDAINHDEIAIKCHEVNYPFTRHHHEDVFHVDPVMVAGHREIDGFWASPDCRHFSRAKGTVPVSKKIRALAWVVVKWARVKRPRRIFLENVREFETWGPLIPHRNKAGEPLWTVTLPMNKNGKPEKKTMVGPEPGTAAAREAKAKLEAKNIKFEPQMMPDPNRIGETYKKWRRELEKLGYVMETKVLNAADFGAPTHRRRFFLIARCDGQPIKWPEPTHGPNRPQPWRTAAECIDWSLPCPSIFLSKEDAKRLGFNVQRPLKKKTQFRIANGLKRYVIESKKPFIVRTGHYSNITGKGGAFRGQDTEQPLGAVCATNDKGLVLPYLVAYYSSGSGNTGHRANAPMQTLTTQDRFGLATAHAVQVNHGKMEGRGQEMTAPLHTLTAKHGTGIVATSLLQYNGEKGTEVRGQAPTAPLNTIPTENRFALVAAFIARIGQYGSNGKMSNSVREPLTTITSKQEHVAAVAHLTKLRGMGGAKRADVPLDTIVAGATTFGATVAHVTQFFGGMTGKEPTEPLPTVTGIDHNGVVTADMVKAGFISSHYGDRPDGTSAVGHDANKPLPTITARATQNQAAEAALAPFVVRCAHGDGEGNTARWGKGEQPVTEPLPTVTGSKDFAATAAYLVHMNHGAKQWSGADEPLRTITAGGNHHYAAEAWITQQVGPGVWEAFCRVYEFLKEHLGEDAPLPIVELESGLYLIVDIGLRMLIPRELLNAQFSPELAKDYVLIGTKTQQVKMIGNSVPPLLAAAVVGANPLDHRERLRRKAG